MSDILLTDTHLSALLESITQAWGKDALPVYSIHGSVPQEPLSLLTEDSRKVRPSALFAAVRGSLSDGHQFISRAIDSGASVILCQDLPTELSPAVCYIQTAEVRRLLALLASAWYEHPSLSLRVVGVTGTNGKTTTATLLYKLFQRAGYRCGLLSTVRNYIHNQAVEATHTTPGPIELQALLAQMLHEGCSHAFMEVSSHAVDQERIAGLHFTGGIFTNLTRDHLDYHGTVREYLYAKKKFFDRLPKSAFALSNMDDRNGLVMLQNTQAKALGYAMHAPAQYTVRILEQYAEGMLLDVAGQEVSVRLVGAFNAYNLLAVYATAVEMGIPQAEVLAHLSVLTSVDGRLQTLSSPRGYTAVVDYAHTPDALNNVLSTLGDLLRSSGQKGKLICVVGCGGDRDKGKRPLMAAEAMEQAHITILTSDNPRSEEPEAIIQDMLQGVSGADPQTLLTITDRAEAIRTACSLASAGDIILVAGKGHETYQEVKGVRYPFDDRLVIEQYFHSETN